MDEFMGAIVCCMALSVLFVSMIVLTVPDGSGQDTIDLLDKCLPVSHGLCDSKDMIFNEQYLDEDGHVMVECGTWYELVSYKVNCEADGHEEL